LQNSGLNKSGQLRCELIQKTIDQKGRIKYGESNRDAPLKIKIDAESGFAWQRSIWA
jgi:hypothetical protein